MGKIISFPYPSMGKVMKPENTTVSYTLGGLLHSSCKRQDQPLFLREVLEHIVMLCTCTQALTKLLDGLVSTPGQLQCDVQSSPVILQHNTHKHTKMLRRHTLIYWFVNSLHALWLLTT